MQLADIPLDQISVMSSQVRRSMDAGALKELTASVRRDGVLQPVLLREVDASIVDGPRYIVVAGHRRVAAARAAGLSTVPAAIGRGESMADGGKWYQLAENIQREDLPTVDTAAALRGMLELCGGDRAELGRRVNKSAGWISKHLTLTSPRLDARIRELLDDGTCDDVEILVSLQQLAMRSHDPREVSRALARAAGGRLTRAEAREMVQRLSKANAVDEGAGDGEGSADGDDAGTATPAARQDITVSLSAADAAKWDALGGAKWLRRQLRHAHVLTDAS